MATAIRGRGELVEHSTTYIHSRLLLRCLMLVVVMAFGFYHLACMLLAIYKPSPRFAVRGLHSTARESDVSSALFLVVRMCSH
jgi:hypothetical protein